MLSFPARDAVKKCTEEIAKEFRKTDFSVLNLENIMGKREYYSPITKDEPNLISDKRFLEYVDELNPTVVNLANNHAKDYGEEAMLDTIGMLKERGYKITGAGKNIITNSSDVPGKGFRENVG